MLKPLPSKLHNGHLRNLCWPLRPASRLQSKLLNELVKPKETVIAGQQAALLSFYCGGVTGTNSSGMSGSVRPGLAAVLGPSSGNSASGGRACVGAAG